MNRTPAARWLRRKPWERATIELIGLGLAMLMQPWSIDLYAIRSSCCWPASSAIRSRASCPMS